MNRSIPHSTPVFARRPFALVLVLGAIVRSTVTLPAAAAPTFQWPVDNPLITQVHACRAGLTGPTSARYQTGINMHAGVDVRPADATATDRTRPVRAAADGWVERLVGYGPASHGLGNTVILRHTNGQFTLYGHLESFQPGLASGQFVARGTPVGLMGNSSTNAQGTFGIHVHFEVKDSASLGNASDAGPYWGYTPGHPDLYGYTDPRQVVSNLTVTAIAPSALRNPPPGALNIRSSPGTNYVGVRATDDIGQMAPGQEVVATKRATVGGVDWFFVDLPSRNTPFDGVEPNNGRHGGWIAGNIAVPAVNAVRVRVIGSAYNVRSGAGPGFPIIGRVYEGQRFVTLGAPMTGAGCSASWHPIRMPGNGTSAPTTGWICGDGVVVENSQVVVTLWASPEAGGSVSGGGLHPIGANVTARAIANPGYAFANWRENGNVVSSSPTYVFGAIGNRILVANFALTNGNGSIRSGETISGTLGVGGEHRYEFHAEAGAAIIVAMGGRGAAKRLRAGAVALWPRWHVARLRLGLRWDCGIRDRHAHGRALSRGR